MLLLEVLKSTDVFGHLTQLPFVAFDCEGQYLKTTSIQQGKFFEKS